MRDQKITFGEMRASGARGVLIYYCDHRCSHHIRISADQWPDHTRLSDIEPRFVCQGCGGAVPTSGRISIGTRGLSACWITRRSAYIMCGA